MFLTSRCANRAERLIFFYLPCFGFCCLYRTRFQDERGFNEFSFDDLEKRLAEEEAAAEAGVDEDGDAEEADMFG